MIAHLLGSVSTPSPKISNVPRAANVILEAADRLVEQPHIGKPARDDMREWFAVFGAGAYVLRYRVRPADDILIIRFWHSREDRDLR